MRSSLRIPSVIHRATKVTKISNLHLDRVANRTLYEIEIDI